MTEARTGTLVLLPCHGVFGAGGRELYAEHPEDRPVYEAQLCHAWALLRQREDQQPLLVISGGATQSESKSSESRSYLEMASTLGLGPASAVALEEFALTSIENLLLGLYVFHQQRGCYPDQVDVVSWEFKRGRFCACLQAINRWPALEQRWEGPGYSALGDLAGGAREAAMAVERKYVRALGRGLAAYYADEQVKGVIARRDAHSTRGEARRRYRQYPLPF